MVELKKTNEASYNSICKGVRDDEAYITSGENDNLIVQKLEANPGTVGLFGYSYLAANRAKLKGLSINGVAPSYPTIANFKYPGARPLYFYVKNSHLNAIPGIKAYVAEFVREGAIGPAGYLTQKGIITLGTPARQRSQRNAADMTPITSAGLK
jgi:phosphate transport system substrate-binding protein